MTTILIIDDEEVNAELVQVYLERYNVDIFVAYTGQEGFSIAKKEQPNLILADLRMPSETWTGYETIKKLKSNSLTQHIPVVALTAAGDVVKALAIGCDEFIKRPFRFQQLDVMLNRYL